MMKYIGVAISGMAIFCMSVYAGNNNRPKGTCGGYRDKNANGFCDISEKMRCKSKRCVASRSNHKNNEAWKDWKKDSKALEFPDQKKESQDSAALKANEGETAKTKTPCPGNCANCPLAGACI